MSEREFFVIGKDKVSCSADCEQEYAVGVNEQFVCIHHKCPAIGNEKHRLDINGNLSFTSVTEKARVCKLYTKPTIGKVYDFEEV